jgi:hypothetical protein
MAGPARACAVTGPNRVRAVGNATAATISTMSPSSWQPISCASCAEATAEAASHAATLPSRARSAAANAARSAADAARCLATSVWPSASAAPRTASRRAITVSTKTVPDPDSLVTGDARHTAVLWRQPRVMQAALPARPCRSVRRRTTPVLERPPRERARAHRYGQLPAASLLLLPIPRRRHGRWTSRARRTHPTARLAGQQREPPRAVRLVPAPVRRFVPRRRTPAAP